MPTVAVPNVLTDPGILYVATLATADPTPTVAGGVFTDDPPVAWLPLGATEGGSTFSYSSTVEPISVAEFFDPIKYATTERSGSIAFNLADFTLTNYKRALNGGAAALAPVSGTGATSLYEFEPVSPGAEVRVKVLWQSTDNTVRLVLRQAIQGGAIDTAFTKAPGYAVIPCTFNMETPVGGAKPFKFGRPVAEFAAVTASTAVDVVGLDVIEKVDAGAALVYALYASDVEALKALPTPVVRAYMRACEAYGVARG